mmetsp:Transcript_2716/g.3565  ORF Transcript_2716/g.3565 Transcript_2716/m.3565 type:complete len:95 (+) Transcript_2716:2480-2764(+)
MTQHVQLHPSGKLRIVRFDKKIIQKGRESTGTVPYQRPDGGKDNVADLAMRALDADEGFADRGADFDAAQAAVVVKVADGEYYRGVAGFEEGEG